MFAVTARLRPAYRATAYIVALPGRRLTLRIGQPPPPLPWGPCRHAAFVTAANPHGIAYRPCANLRASRRLAARLRLAGLRFCRGEGVADAGDWPAEPSVLIFGLPPRAAFAIGRQLRQNAILRLRQHSHVTLVSLR
jgi:predicted fused transcriptional regulator/phosphomethylpyrimidine kinase